VNRDGLREGIVETLAGCVDPRLSSVRGCCALCHNTTEHTDWCPWLRATRTVENPAAWCPDCGTPLAR
jgi:hypothetical protein